MPKVYDFDTMNRVAKAGSTFIEKYLKSKPNVVDVVNVEEDPAYQKKDIDLVVHMQKGEAIETYTVEIKVDQYFDKTKNYFFETVSNDVYNTLGCFLKSEADFLFYYFPRKEIHIFALDPAREWFMAHKDEFEERWVQNQNYRTKGSLVPRKQFIENNEVKVVKIK